MLSFGRYAVHWPGTVEKWTAVCLLALGREEEARKYAETSRRLDEGDGLGDISDYLFPTPEKKAAMLETMRQLGWTC